ncbi:hypothetical protein [Exilibacterium tricleocarpae]|uniref:hypothetical protein n=1 Tax=Exilibacterium tricleocarpae TaxID=2591008 RepID=UPI0015D1ABE5|nr:hypothetical protein [Exilibacterium tricleocarpae]
MRRDDGQVQPGIRWLGFTLRIPLVHTKVAWPELAQGMLVAATTALALVPVLTIYFGLTFEEAVAMAMLHSVLINASWWLFGEPYAPGWVTPALPFVLTLVVSESYPTPELRFQMMTALALNFALVLAVLGVTGLGAKLIRIIPETLKGGIILGAAIAAFLQVFDLDNEQNVLHSQPLTIITALALSLLLAFSTPLQRLQTRFRWIAIVASFGLLPGFAIGALVGTLAGELTFNIQSGWTLLPLGSLWEKSSPFSIGWPGLEMYLQALPLALITYVLLFGDLITGDEVLRDGSSKRSDEKLEINHSRTHLSLSIRNAVMSIVAPFFPTQGILWTGIHVVIIQRWKQGRQAMDSFFDGVSSYYVLAIPFLFYYLPFMTAMRPLMDMALAITLVLTGFACAYIAMSKANTPAERGSLLLSGICLALFEPWLGLLLAVVSTAALVGLKPQAQGVKKTKTGSGDTVAGG